MGHARIAQVTTVKELSAKEVADLPADGKRHWVAPNLYLVRRHARDPGLWYFLYRSPVLGKPVEMGLGSRRDVSYSLATTEALEYRLLLRKGRCPKIERDAAQAEHKPAPPAHTFRAVAKLYIAAHEAGWRTAKQGQQWRQTLETYAYPVLGEMAVHKITTAEVMSVLDPIWRTKAETAARVRGRVESIIDYARARGWSAAENPARWRGHLEQLLPARAKVAKVKHHPAVPWPELPQLYQALRSRDDVPALALRYVILTALRTSEALLTQAAGEIDRAAQVHTVPGVRTKSGRDHRVPLCPEALRVIDAAAAIRTGALLFNGTRPGRPLGKMTVPDLLKTLAPAATVHGMRSCFRDWCAEHGVARELAETALSHVVEDKTEAAYLRGDQLELRRAVMERWAEFLTTPVLTEMATAAE